MGSLGIAAQGTGSSPRSTASALRDSSGAGALAAGAAVADAALAPGAARALQASGATPSGVSGPLTTSVDISPFFPNGDGVRDRTTLTVDLAAAATLSVTVMSYDGATIKKLAKSVSAPAGRSTWSWDGYGAKVKGARKQLVPDGAYFFRATAVNASGTFSVDRWVAKDKLIPYPIAPQSVVVAIDSGHGGPDSGAYYQKVREADMNVDIAIRLQHMLESAGVTVVMMRDHDTAINDPPYDVNGDGEIDHSDELIIRNDIANLARADLHVVLMNNAYGCHCATGTETYTSGERSWTPEGVDLARYIQAAHMTRLKPFKTKSWKPNDRGVKLWDYAAIRPYQRREMPRPDLMPSVLVESLFMDHPKELKVLTTPAARAALADAYFDGIVKWLSKRAYGLRYTVTAAPTSVQTGGTADYRMQLTNRGNTPSAGWVLEARMVTAAPGQPYDGSPVSGTLVAQTAVPNGLKPGQSVAEALNGVPVPTVAGNWLVKFDVRLPDGTTLQDHGVVGPQLPLTTVEPPPPPTPTPEPTQPPTAAPTSSPTATPSPSPTLQLTPSPTSAPTLEPTAEPTASLTPEPTASPEPEPTASPAPEPTVRPSTAEPTPSPDPTIDATASPDGRSAPASAAAAETYDVAAVPPRLFGRALPRDPDAGQPGAAGSVHWALRAAWRRYITAIDIPPELPYQDAEAGAAASGTAAALRLGFFCSIR